MNEMSSGKTIALSLSLWMALALPSSAEEPPAATDVYELDEIVVTATRMDAPRDTIAANITIVTKAEIDVMPVSNLAELLQYVPGVYVELAGGLGSQAVVRIQGSEVRHVAVYQDGVPLNQLANPLTDLSYLPVDTIEQVEIYKGPASAAWGSSLGGVINIITREPDTSSRLRADLHTSYGEFSTLKSRGGLSGRTSRFSYLLSLTHDESDGFTEHTDYGQDAVYAKVGYGLGDIGEVSVVYSYDEGRNGDPVPQFPQFFDDSRRTRSYQRILFEMSPADGLSFALEGRHHRFDSMIEDVFSDHRETFNDYEDRIYGIGARLSWKSNAANTLNVGFDEDWGWYDWFRYDREYETRNAALYANDTLTVGRASINLGLRYDDNRDFGSAISPSAGVVYRFLDGRALVRGQVARGFSAPPAAWVHDPTFGDPDLDPEVGVNYQIGGQLSPLPFMALELSLFQSDIEDLINFDFDSLRFGNIGKATKKGVEGHLKLHFDVGLTLTLGGSYVDLKDDTTGQEIKDVPKTIYNVSATYANGWMTHSILGRHIDHNSSFPETQDQVFVLDYQIRIKCPLPGHPDRLSLYGAVHNLTNASYLYRNIWPQPDRWFEGGISLQF